MQELAQINKKNMLCALNLSSRSKVTNLIKNGHISILPISAAIMVTIAMVKIQTFTLVLLTFLKIKQYISTLFFGLEGGPK